MGPRPVRALVGGAPDRAPPPRGGLLVRVLAAGGLCRAAALGDALPDRLPDCCAPAGLGRGNAGAPAARPARPRARPPPPRAGEPGARRAALVGRLAAHDGRARPRQALGRSPRGRACDRGATVKIAVISPVWFPVPPTGYGGIEWIVWLLADGLVDAGHDVTLFASGDSTTKAKLVAVYETAPSELIGNSITELHHALACYERSGEFDVVNDHSGLPAAAVGGAVS